MRTLWPGVLAFGLSIALSMPVIVAEDATERAGALKTWRDQCNDPDTDLRTAYIEAALATKDTAVIRICVRQSLESDDADIRNLGLRAAIGSIDQLHFDVTMPDILSKALEEADGDAEKLREINRWYIAHDWDRLHAGLVFAVRSEDVSIGVSTWMPMVNRTKPSEKYSGTTTIIGDRLTWVGSADLSASECHMSLVLSDGATLEGTWQCGNLAAFTLSAALL